MFDLNTNGRIPAPAQPGDRAQGSVAVLDLVADKWTMRVVYTLKSGSRHYGEILRTIEGISKKMLTQTLRDLERNGFVTRTVHPTNPPTVEYALTPLG
jgi:DNA-binding HxlR family transcriptional regulator